MRLLNLSYEWCKGSKARCGHHVRTSGIRSRAWECHVHHVTPAHLQIYDLRFNMGLLILGAEITSRAGAAVHSSLDPSSPSPHYILCSFGLGGCLLAGALQLPAAVDRARRSQPQWLHAVHLGGSVA